MSSEIYEAYNKFEKIFRVSCPVMHDFINFFSDAFMNSLSPILNITLYALMLGNKQTEISSFNFIIHGVKQRMANYLFHIDCN